MKIGYRTIKTAVGTPISVSLAQLIGVTNFASAGILTILCIQPSRKRSVKSAWDRFVACILAILFSAIFFEVLSYSLITLAILLMIFIPTTVFLKIESGILTSTVITLNIYSFGYMEFNFIIEQFFIIGIGIGTGLLINLYMPSLDKSLKKHQKNLEEKFQVVFYEIAKYIRNKNMDWDGKEITDIEAIFEEAEELVKRDKENHLLRDDNTFEQYFRMRKKQFDLLKQMLPIVTNIPVRDDISEAIAQFFEEIGDHVHPGDTSIIFLQNLKELKKDFHNEDLPETREDFESRANLFQLMFLLERYLELKNNLNRRKITKKQVKHSKAK